MIHTNCTRQILTMSRFQPSPSSFLSLKDSVIVLTGGGAGIGLATVALLTSNGAKVVYGDISHPTTPLGANITFVHCDVTSYADLYALFRKAYDVYGHVDHAISSAGILEQGKWFDRALTIDAVKEPETTKVLDVNLRGSCNFARIAAVFLRNGAARPDGDNKSLTLLSSIAGIRDIPGLSLHQASKYVY